MSNSRSEAAAEFFDERASLEPRGEYPVVDSSVPGVVGHLGILDTPGPWGRIGAFGHGLVDVEWARR